MPSSPAIRLATASPGTQATTAATLAQLALVAQRAASHGADILLLPEAYIGGYPRGSAFGCVIGDRSAAGREEFAKYFETAVDLGDTVEGGAGAGQRWVKRQLDGYDGSPAGTETENGKPARGDGTREELERIAGRTGVFIVTGLIEKAGGSLYCSAVYVCPKLGMIGKRRKVMPTAIERLIWAQGSPATLRAVSTVIKGQRINIGAAICWESYMPLLRQALYSQNINLYLAPTADGRDAWLGLMRTIGVEGRCFVVSSNMGIRGGRPGSSSAEALETLEEETTDGVNGNGERGRRRNSAITAEGFEIALPPKSPSSTRRRTRRKSVFDEDGNEIVLCCDEDGSAATETETPDVNGVGSRTGSTAKSATRGNWVSRGGSSIVSPFGDVLAGPQWEDEEGIIYADVDFRDCIKGRLDLDAAGSYSRNDSFKFSVEGLNLDPLPY